MAEKFNQIELQSLTKTLSLPDVLYFEETDSTNTQGLKLAAEGADEFTLLIAERQTAGRGRLGRKWVTGPGTSLAFSVILHPNDDEIPLLSLFSLLGGLAVCRAIKTVCGAAEPKVKWPNDVLLDGKKTAGILAETNWQGDILAGLVLGIGINIFAGSVPPADDLQFPATCVQAHCKNPIRRFKFLATILQEIITLRPLIKDAVFIKEYRQHLAFLGQTVFLKSSEDQTIQGTLAGVSENGRVIIRDQSGSEKKYPIGDMHLRPGK